jgi:Domain of unknown function (DUF4340)
MKNANPWTLVAVFGGLVLLFVAVKLYRSPILESNLPPSLVEIDTAAITELVITPAKARSENVRIVKSEGWKLVRDNRNLRLDQGAGPNALRMLMSAKPERMISKRKEKWDEFGVGDSTGTRVRIMAGTSSEAELIIGRSGFGQSGGQGYGPPYTYVRVADEPEVYAVSGFLDAQFNRVYDDWRDKSFLRLVRDSVNHITFRYPSDSSFVLDKRQGTWMLNDGPADSASVNSYLGSLGYRNVQAFASSQPAGSAPIVITFEKSGKTQATVEAWPAEYGFVTRSSHQPETFFFADAVTARDILRSKKGFQVKQ